MVELPITQALAGTPGHYGAPGHDVALAEVIISTCWTVQGDAARAAFATECERRFDLELPRAASTTARSGGWTALWLGPRSWLLILDPRRDPLPPDAFLAARGALNEQGGALFDTSASRVAFAISGACAATVLAKSCPLDLHAAVFSPGRCAQTALGHGNVQLYRPNSTTTIIAMVARSLARDVWHTLCASAAQYGYDVTAPVMFGDRVEDPSAPIPRQVP